MIYHEYTSAVKDAVKDYYLFNNGKQLTNIDVEMMERHDVLRIFLEWEGIIGYTWLIENIFECDEHEE